MAVGSGIHMLGVRSKVFAKLLADDDADATTWRNRLKTAVQAKSNQHLLVTKDGVKLWRVAVDK